MSLDRSTFIVDRTQADISTAFSVRENYVQKGKELTEIQVQQLERGTMTISTLNRIEQAQDFLKGMFNNMGYFNTNIVNKSWDYTQIFDVAELQRIIENTNILRNAFFVYKDTPNTPPVSYHYNDINALEKILYDLDVMINDVKANYRFCGEFVCGE